MRCKSRRLELKANHELNLPWQARAGIRRGGVVVVVVEIVGGVDQAKAASGLKYPVVGYRGSLAICCLDVVESQVVGIWIAELNVVEDVEYLHANYQSIGAAATRGSCYALD